jgi:hypothetical protein
MPSSGNSDSYPWSASQKPLTDPIDQYRVSTLIGHKVYVYNDKVERGEDVPWVVGQTRKVLIDHGSIKVENENGKLDSYHLLQSSESSMPSQ